MATPKRIWYEGASYHITARGNHRNDIFRDESDFNMYLVIMKESLKYYERYKYELTCYCLMTNHIHLLICANGKEVEHLIRRVHSIYSRYFNKKYNYVGHLWQDKYFAELIEDDSQMLQTSRYIHLNPVRAKMVEDAQNYKWSSYSMYLGLEREELIKSQNILAYFKNDNCRELYKQFVESAIKVKNNEVNDKEIMHKEVI